MAKKPKVISEEKLAERMGWCSHYISPCPSGSVYVNDDRMLCSKCYTKFRNDTEPESQTE